jgi:CheY-like chemotaxis protein
MFDGSHHRLLLASNGRQAIEMARQAKPDLILLDVRMPEMDGHQVLRALREIPALALTPVVAVTASTLTGEENEIKAQFSGYLQKPFSRQDLFDEMARFLPRFQQGDLPADQPQDTDPMPASTSSTDDTETPGEKKDQRLGRLTHDLKSSLAGVVMSAELLLEQPACVNDVASARLVTDILHPARRLLASVKNFSAHPHLHSPGEPPDRNQLQALLADDFKVQCNRMEADADNLCRLTARRAEARSVQLAENIVRSSRELANFVAAFTARDQPYNIPKPPCRDVSEPADHASPRYRPSALLTSTQPTHGLSGY